MYLGISILKFRIQTKKISLASVKMFLNDLRFPLNILYGQKGLVISSRSTSANNAEYLYKDLQLWKELPIPLLMILVGLAFLVVDFWSANNFRQVVCLAFLLLSILTIKRTLNFGK